MEQAITDYVKFLADARDAVYRLNNDQATAKQLKEQGERQEKELAAAKKAVTDSVNQTIKKRRSEIDTSYDPAGKSQKQGNEGTDRRGDQ